MWKKRVWTHARHPKLLSNKSSQAIYPYSRHRLLYNTGIYVAMINLARVPADVSYWCSYTAPDFGKSNKSSQSRKWKKLGLTPKSCQIQKMYFLYYGLQGSGIDSRHCFMTWSCFVALFWFLKMKIIRVLICLRLRRVWEFTSQALLISFLSLGGSENPIRVFGDVCDFKKGKADSN